MPIAILEPFSGISGDMTLGALVDVGLDPEWLRALPARLALEGVTVHVQRVLRSGIVCTKVDFDIPPQPHGRHLAEIRQLVARASLPADVQRSVDAVFSALTEAEGAIHGVAPERVHLHEVGAVDAILDVVGSVWGFAMLGVSRIYCGPIALGDGSVRAAHGVLPVPAPATLKLLEGHTVLTGPEGAGELVTPTGAALVRVLSSGPPPAAWLPQRSGYGAGSKDPHGRPNALRIVLAEPAGAAGLGSDGALVEQLVMLSTDIDDLDGESLAAVADGLRTAGALDVVLLPALMKKGRPGTRLEVLGTMRQADALERWLLVQSSTLGVRRTIVERHALPRQERQVEVLGHAVRVKVATLPDGGHRAKPEFDDVARVAAVTGQPHRAVADAARRAAEQVAEAGISPAASRGSP